MVEPKRFIEPVVRESTPSIIASKLRDAIRHGELAPGQQLGEADLARQLGVSRGPLREGMQRLTQEGLLVSIRNRGLFVVDVTADDVRDIYVARGAIERTAAAQILKHGAEDAARQLLNIIDTMDAAFDRDDVVAIGEIDLEFHSLLVQLSRSPRLVRMHDTLLTETRLCINALGGAYPTVDIRAREHREIAEAIGAGDAALVDQLIVDHMDDAVARLVTVVPGQNSATSA